MIELTHTRNQWARIAVALRAQGRADLADPIAAVVGLPWQPSQPPPWSHPYHSRPYAHADAVVIQAVAARLGVPDGVPPRGVPPAPPTLDAHDGARAAAVAVREFVGVIIDPVTKRECAAHARFEFTLPTAANGHPRCRLVWIAPPGRAPITGGARAYAFVLEAFAAVGMAPLAPS